MLSRDHFYWTTTRKSIIAFGNMFSNIYVIRNKVNDDPGEVIRVPISYAPRQGFIARIEQQPDIDNKSFQVVLPAMAFEFAGMVYDPTRKISPITQNRTVNSNPNTLTAQYAPTPYNLSMNLYVYARNQDDGLQIIEQIIPFFNPDYNLVLKAIPALDIKNDLPITLETISYEDNYESDFTTRRSIIWTLNFSLKLNYYGPKADQGIIRKVIATTFSNEALSNTQTTYTVEASPANANAIANITYLETFTEF